MRVDYDEAELNFILYVLCTMPTVQLWILLTALATAQRYIDPFPERMSTYDHTGFGKQGFPSAQPYFSR
ncbi:hypothetical protein BDV36DRAFT_71989 [Aspergillus pseudocaelatus]|uniref:Uncharacterized protein n=1 Tax=Aspergillus pseudocaelatus TaxID=1825620 RepID=A0ABQ6W446_9EURO|nr:hypothetical protein BDV36DRAFT_71989 [Aspergillus pseudocaelatus]